MSCSWLSELMLLGALPPDELRSEGPSGAGLLPEGAADFFSGWRDPMAPHLLASRSRCATLAPRWGTPGTLGTCSHSRCQLAKKAAIDQLATSGGLLLTRFLQHLAYKHACRCLSPPCAPPRTCPMWRGSCGTPVKIFCQQRCSASSWRLHRHTAHSVSTILAGSPSTASSALLYTAFAAPVCRQLTDEGLLPIPTLVMQKRMQDVTLHEVGQTLHPTNYCARHSLTCRG